MAKFLTIQNSYLDIQLALMQDTRIADSVCADKIAASKMLVPLVGELLAKNSVHLSELNFIAANIGPGPYTTLRTVLASVNGLSFATQLPLIGVDSLDAMMRESLLPVRPEFRAREACPEYRRVIVLLNAFNQDVYFAIQSPNGEIQKGCMNVNALLAHVAQTIPNDLLHFVGNGTKLHRDLIKNSFGTRAAIPEPIAEGPSIHIVGAIALAKWKNQEGLERQLMPVYLK